MCMVFLKVILIVQVLLDIVDVVLAILEEPLEVPALLAMKPIRNLKENVFTMANMVTDHVILFNISVLLACKVCKVQTLFWLLRPN